jgi:hypothetical protein
MRYASRLVRRVPSDLDGRLFFSVSPSAGRPRACGVLAQEDGCWIVTLIGYFGDQPPLDDAGFLAFARSLPAPEVSDLLQRAEPLGPIRPFAFAANQRVHHERMTTRPAGLLAIGDALASFSPVYGQGMSVAALQALALRACLSHPERVTFEARYLRCAVEHHGRQRSSARPGRPARHLGTTRTLPLGATRAARRSPRPRRGERIPERGAPGFQSGDAVAPRCRDACPASELRTPVGMTRRRVRNTITGSRLAIHDDLVTPIFTAVHLDC